MKLLFERFIKKLQNGSYFEAAIYAVLTAMIASIIIIITYVVGSLIFILIKRHLEVLVTIVGAYWLLYSWMKDRHKKRNREIQSSIMKKGAISQEMERELFDSNYVLARQCLFSILIECSEVLKLVKPERLSDLDSSCRTIYKGNVCMPRFMIMKNGDVNTDKIKEIIQARIGQKLNSFELGITQTMYIFNGMAYQMLCVDEIYDEGAFIIVDMAWASENYCKLLSMRAQAKMQYLSSQEIEHFDEDF